jgi:lipopolysaccharide transport system ATP-binding protein
MSTVIEFNNVSKSYRMDRGKPRSFQELFVSLARPITRRTFLQQRAEEKKVFWSLREVSFGVGKGETVGIVGANGAGKSTSLKLISRIISPTSGKVIVNGRVTALLELGAGFHPELSGRDNVYLNGTVMGLTRKQIDYRVDQIIDFAEVGDFIDVPVKDYSSGMFARLGFSVAVHLDPEIVLLDEVLSVGDQAFQQKCNERMLKLRKQGVTTVFVSHSTDAVWRICSRAVWLHKGKLKQEGPAHKVVDAYYKYMLEKNAASQTQQQPAEWVEGRTGSGEVRVTEVEFLGEEMKARRIFMTNEPMIVRMRYQADEAIADPLFGLGFFQADSEAHLAGPNNELNNYAISLAKGKGYVDYRIERLPFLPGEYLLTTAIYDHEEIHPYDVWHKCARFTVVPGGTQERYGYFALEGAWHHQTSANSSHSSEQRIGGWASQGPSH